MAKPKITSAIEAATRECFVDTDRVNSGLFAKALQKRNIVTRGVLPRLIESEDYLSLEDNNNTVVLDRSKLKGMLVYPTLSSVQEFLSNFRQTTSPPPLVYQLVRNITSTARQVPELTIECDTTAILNVIGYDVVDHYTLSDNSITDIFLDAGSKVSIKANGKCIRYDDLIMQSDVDEILEQLSEGEYSFEKNNRVIIGKTLHRLAALTYDGSITGISIRIGRTVSGLLPVFEGLIEHKNILLCGPPNVGKTTTLREICKYLSNEKCLCLIDSSGEVCGEEKEYRGDVVGHSRIFRPESSAKQYATLLDCVKNHSPDIIAIDELHTKEEMEACQTIAMRSVQMIASVHGNIQDVIFNPMLNKALGGSINALVSDQVAVNGKKVVTQRTNRPIFDVVININRKEDYFEYTFIDDVANNVSRIMEGKPINIRRRYIIDEELHESKDEVLYPSH